MTEVAIIEQLYKDVCAWLPKPERSKDACDEHYEIINKHFSSIFKYTYIKNAWVDGFYKTLEIVLKHPKIKIPFDSIKKSTIWTMFQTTSHMDNKNIDSHDNIIDLLISLYPDNYIEIDDWITKNGWIYATNFTNYYIQDLLIKALPYVFKKHINTYLIKYPPATTNYKDSIIQAYNNLWNVSFKNSYFFPNMIYLLDNDLLKNVLLGDILPTIIKYQHLYDSTAPNVALWLIKREKIIGQEELKLCINYCNYDAVEYLVDQKCLVFLPMVDSLINFRMAVKVGRYINDFSKLIKFLGTLTEFSKNVLTVLAILDFMSFDDMQMLTDDKLILSIYDPIVKDLNWTIKNMSLSEIQKKVKADSVITKHVVMTLIYMDKKRNDIVEYILELQNVEVDIECLITAKQMAVGQTIMELLTAHYLKQRKSFS